MRQKIISYIGLFTTFPLWSVAQPSVALSFSKSASEIQAVSRALVEAQLRYDAPAITHLLAKDFIYVGNDGSVVGRAAFLPTAKDRKQQPLKVLEWTLVRVRFYADTAVALYDIHEKGIDEGKLYEFRGHSLATWVKQGERWICTAIHD